MVLTWEIVNPLHKYQSSILSIFMHLSSLVVGENDGTDWASLLERCLEVDSTKLISVGEQSILGPGECGIMVAVPWQISWPMLEIHWPTSLSHWQQSPLPTRSHSDRLKHRFWQASMPFRSALMMTGWRAASKMYIRTKAYLGCRLVVDESWFTIIGIDINNQYWELN